MNAPAMQTFWASGQARPEGAIGIFQPMRVQFQAPADADQSALNDAAVAAMRAAGYEPLYAVAYPLEMCP